LTGPLTFLPIHAAGLYGPNSESPVLGSKLVDYVVSSYTPTLTALIDGWRPRAQSKPKLLAVALPLESGLFCAQNEIDRIQQHVNLVPDFSLKPLIESNATVKGVEEGMQECSWVHFACHGVQDISNPTRSALLLAQHARLTLSNISKLSLPHAELAYLSACQTATGTEDLSEEAVHLTAGMLLAGYRGVIGTMWSIIDQDAPQVADVVYAQLFKEQHPDATQAAFALHEAVKKLCNESKEKKSFFSWVPYIHVGI
jgi:CHAT domain-containing protein